jgi:hypothetical protein
MFSIAMNCFLESLASAWLVTRRRLVPEPIEEEVMTAQDGLEQCRKNMEERAVELRELVAKLGHEVVSRRRANDMSTAKSKLLERKRAQKRLDRLRNGIDLVDSQLDAIRTSELDKEIMLTLKASTNAMRKAGIGVAVQDIENVMTELDEHIREAQDVTTALSNPLNVNDMGDMDLEAEINMMMREDSDDLEITTPAPITSQTRTDKTKEIATPAEVIPLLVDKMPCGDAL